MGDRLACRSFCRGLSSTACRRERVRVRTGGGIRSEAGRLGGMKAVSTDA